MQFDSDDLPSVRWAGQEKTPRHAFAKDIARAWSMRPCVSSASVTVPAATGRLLAVEPQCHPSGNSRFIHAVES